MIWSVQFCFWNIWVIRFSHTHILKKFNISPRYLQCHFQKKTTQISMHVLVSFWVLYTAVLVHLYVFPIDTTLSYHLSPGMILISERQVLSYGSSFFIFKFFFCLFLGLHPRHVEVPRLGSNQSGSHWPSCSHIQCRICGLNHSSWQYWIRHWARQGIEPMSSWILVRFVNGWAAIGTPGSSFWVSCLFLSFALSCTFWNQLANFL